MTAASLITLLILASVSITNAHSSDEGNQHRLQAFLDMKCSDPKKPNFCRPYGSCCGHDEFCSSLIRQCDSCFPQHLHNNQDELLQWCKEFGQFSASLMNSPTCTVACQARFTPWQLDIDNNTEPSSSVSWDDGNHIAVYVTFGVIVFALLIGIICILYRNRSSRRGRENDRVELGDLGNESEVEEVKTPSDLGLKKRLGSPTSMAKTDETKSKAVPVHSNQEETEPLIDNGLGDSVKSTDSLDDGAQAASSETTTPKTSEPQSPQENSTPHKTSVDNMIFSPQLSSESADQEHAPVVTTKTSYSYQVE